MSVLQPPPVFTGLSDAGGVIVPIWSAWFVAVQAGQVALTNAPVLVTTATAALPFSVNLGALTTGLLKATVAAGIAAITSVALPLSVANGGTGLTAGTSGGVLAFTATGTLASSGLLTANALVLGGGAGAVPTVLGSLGTTTTVLHGNAAGAPTWAAVSLTADVTGTLAAANGGTGLGSIAALRAALLPIVLTADVSGILPIANGGTAASGQTANGIAYFSAGSQIVTSAAWTYNGAGAVALTAPAATNAALTLSTPSTFSAQLNFNVAATNIWKVGFGIGAAGTSLEIYNTANAATMLLLASTTTLTLSAVANQNSTIQAVSTVSNGFGAQFLAQSKTAGGATNAWTWGTGITASDNRWTLFNDSLGASVLDVSLTGRVAFQVVGNLKNYTVATLPAGVRGDIAYVTNALAPTFLAVVVGGGAVVAPVFYDGANWVGF